MEPRERSNLTGVAQYQSNNNNLYQDTKISDPNPNLITHQPPNPNFILNIKKLVPGRSGDDYTRLIRRRQSIS